MAVTVTCSDFECKHNENGECSAAAIGHTSDRFCVNGRRRPRDETAELMQHFKANCRPTQFGFKVNHRKIVK